jgi:hypothetical protein
VALVLVATVGSATANSFATISEANAYLEGRLNADAWETIGSTQTKALVEATRELDALRWQGWRTDAVQALSWPRTGVVNPDAPSDALTGLVTGYPEYDDDVIPVRIKRGTIELALEFLRAGDVDISGTDEDAAIIREKTGPLETEWVRGQRPIALSRYPRVMAQVGVLLLAGSGQLDVVRS